MIVKFTLSILAIFFPWLVLLIYDNPTGALMALILQATVIGWIPASVWAWRMVHQSVGEKKSKEQVLEEEKE